MQKWRENMRKWKFTAHTSSGTVRFTVRAEDKPRAIRAAFDKLRAEYHETAMRWDCALCG